jgi:hypothetical protein
LAINEWLPQIAHFNIFVIAHKNANEPAGDCHSGRTQAALVLGVMAAFTRAFTQLNDSK